MIHRCISVPGPCSRCSRQSVSNADLCDTCLVGGKPARPHPKRCRSCHSWNCDGHTTLIGLPPVKTSFKAVAA